ncbi:MAG: hypothetical protein JWO38_3567 [Gemmataceae bacterium]|nr:hypothetical protein [Gemmataceae bacterium]
MTAQALQTEDETLASALAAGRRVAQAAETAGISESTAYHRLREPDVQARVFEIRAGVIETARNRIANRTIDACDTLTQLLVSRSEAIQLRAAKTLIELAVKLHDRDRHAVPPVPTEVSPVKSDRLSTTTPAPQVSDPQEPEPVRSEPIDLPRPVTARPEVTSTQEEGSTGSSTGPVPVSSPANGDSPMSSAEVARRVASTPSLLVTGGGGGSNKAARDLSNPVKTCHRPADRLPVSEVNRLSTGLTVALAGMGGE